MGLFGRKAAAPARPALARGIGQMFASPDIRGGGISGDWPGGYEAQVRAAFLANPVAQRAVRIIAEGAAAIPVYAAGDGETDMRAARMAGEGGLIETIAAQLVLHGNAFVQIAGDADGQPFELFALRPERVTIELDASGWPAAYLYRIGERSTRFAARDAMGMPGLVHLRALNPLDDHYGAGCLGAAAGAVAAHNAAARWNKALLDNQARPSGALVHEAGDGGGLSTEQYDRLRAEMDASFTGAANAGRPMLLEGGLRWQAMSLTPADMDFAGLKAGVARDIALAFGVPPMILGLPGDNTYSNYAEANRALWRLTIVPLATKIMRGIEAGLRAWWPDIALALDLDQLPALSSDREALWNQARQADFLTTDEKREMVGFGALEPVQQG